MGQRDRAPRPAPEWTPGRIRALAGGVVVGLAMVVGGLVLAFAPSGHRSTGTTPVASDTSPGTGAGPAVTSAPTTSAGGGRSTQSARDALAARPMSSAPGQAARPAPVSTRDPGPPIVLPACPKVGPAGVPTGCPHTAAGAMAQLAAIDQTAMQSGTLPGARAVIAVWATPGGPTTESWSGISAMASIFNGAGDQAPARLPLVVTPVMGLIKGSVGPDYVIPCIDFEFDLTLIQTARVAAADCQRMVWTGGRWMIGPGTEPAQPPSVWPDTDTAIDAGYRDLSWQR